MTVSREKRWLTARRGSQTQSALRVEVFVEVSNRQGKDVLVLTEMHECDGLPKDFRGLNTNDFCKEQRVARTKQLFSLLQTKTPQDTSKRGSLLRDSFAQLSKPLLQTKHEVLLRIGLRDVSKQTASSPCEH